MGFIEILKTEDVTDEVITHAERIYDCYFANQAGIDWEHFFDVFERLVLEDGAEFDFGSFFESPAILKIKKHINAYRKL